MLLFNFMAIKCYNQTNSSPRCHSLPLHTITNVLQQLALQSFQIFLSEIFISFNVSLYLFYQEPNKPTGRLYGEEWRGAKPGV